MNARDPAVTRVSPGLDEFKQVLMNYATDSEAKINVYVEL
jgi:hypothetical protein